MSSDIFCQEVSKNLGISSIDENLCDAIRCSLAQYTNLVAKLADIFGRALTSSELANAWKFFVAGNTDAQAIAELLRELKPSRSPRFGM